MKTRVECLQHAVMCEHMASDTAQDAHRTVLLTMAAHWRTLADHAPMPARSGTPRNGETSTSVAPANEAMQARDVEERAAGDEHAIRITREF